MIIIICVLYLENVMTASPEAVARRVFEYHGFNPLKPKLV
jgi:hypothetical protein